MKFKKPNPELCEYLEGAVESFPTQKRKMFGSPVWFVNGNMFTGVHQDDIFVRLSKEEQEALFQEFDEAHPFEPLPGRQMKAYAVLPDSVYNHTEEFIKWLGRSFEYTHALPPKRPKKK